MSNAQFGNWTRRVAFSLDLSEQAIYDLLTMYGWERDIKSRGIVDVSEYADRYRGRRGAAGYLCRRGMVVIDNKTGGYVTTRAGRLTAELLVEAGFSAPPTVGDVFPNNPVTQRPPFEWEML